MARGACHLLRERFRSGDDSTQHSWRVPLHCVPLIRRRYVSISLLAFVGATMNARPVVAEVVPPSFPAAAASAATRGDVAFPAFQIDGGIARDLERHRWVGLVGAAAGVGLYDGNRLWELTAGAQVGRRMVTISLDRTTVQTGLGLHGTTLWDLDRRAPGVGVGVSFSLVEVQGSIVLEDRLAGYISIFLSVPVGFLVHLARGGHP